MRDIWYCTFCLRQSYIEHDGVNGHCVGCKMPVVNKGDIFHAAWFPLAEAAVSAVSRPAGVALETLARIDESAPSNWQPLLNLAGVLIIGAVGGLILREALTGS